MSSKSNGSETARQFAQYSVVGAIAFLADFSLLVLLTSGFRVHYLISATVGFSLGIVISYALCVSWVFDFRAVANRRIELAIFATVGVVGLILNNLTMFVFIEYAGLAYIYAKFVAAAIVLAFNFSVRRSLLFSPR